MKHANPPISTNNNDISPPTPGRVMMFLGAFGIGSYHKEAQKIFDKAMVQSTETIQRSQEALDSTQALLQSIPTKS